VSHERRHFCYLDRQHTLLKLEDILLLDVLKQQIEMGKIIDSGERSSAFNRFVSHRERFYLSLHNMSYSKAFPERVERMCFAIMIHVFASICKFPIFY